VLERTIHSTYNPVIKQVCCTLGGWESELIIYRNGYQFGVKVDNELMPYPTCVLTLLNSYEAAVGGGLIDPTNTLNGVVVRQLMENAIRSNKIVKIYEGSEHYEIPGKAENFMAFWQSKLDKITTEFMDSTRIQVEAGSFQDSAAPGVEISCIRPENDNKMESR
jgi:hypothetical protein